MADNFSEEMGHIGNPQFMGQQLGAVSIEKVRAMIKRQKRLKGFAFDVPVGTSSFDINLSGTARLLLGLAVLPDTLPVLSTEEPIILTDTTCFCGFAEIESLQFTVNNEIVIDTLNPNFLTSKFNNNEYYYIPRPLSGTDQITMKFVNSGTIAEKIKVVIYYI